MEGRRTQQVEGVIYVAIAFFNMMTEAVQTEGDKRLQEKESDTFNLFLCTKT